MFCQAVLPVLVIILRCLLDLAATADEGSSRSSNGNNFVTDSSIPSTVTGGSNNNNTGSETQPSNLSYTFQMSLTNKQAVRVPWGYANARCKAQDVRRRLPVLKDAVIWNGFLSTVKAINDDIMRQGRQPLSVLPLGAYKLNDEWYWLDGTKMADGIINWQKGQPNGTTVPENCIALNLANGDIGYGDVECSLGFSFICQYDKGKTAGKMNNGAYSSAIMSKPSDCATGWDSAGGVCYKEPSESITIATPDEGAAACAKLDPKARLPEFYNSDDYDGFIRYLGKKVGAEHRNIALGFQKNGTDFVNSDGKAYYLNWYQDEPTVDKACTFANDVNGYMWSAMDCTEKGVIFCQLDSRTVQSVKKISSVPVQVVSSNSVPRRGGGGNTSGHGGKEHEVPKNASASVQTSSTVSSWTGGGGDGSDNGSSSTISGSSGSSSSTVGGSGSSGSSSGGSSGSSGGGSSSGSNGGDAGSSHSGSSFKTLNVWLFLSCNAVAVVSATNKYWKLFPNSTPDEVQ